MTKESTHPRKPWVALVLSLVLTGLGHVYCGRIVKALVLLAIYMMFLPAVILTARLSPSTAILVGMLLLALITFGVILYALIDAFLLARRLGDFRLKMYNRVAVYVTFAVLGLAYPTVISEYVKANALQAFYILAPSMAPSILQGDYVMVNRWVYRSAEPARGDVVALRSPDDRQRRIVKRVIAVPGDTVEVRDDRVYVNGAELVRSTADGDVVVEENASVSYPILPCRDVASSTSFPPSVVPDGHCFVLGDNRDRSHDGRHFGFVPLEDLLGPVQYIYLPAESWSRFGALPK